MARLDVAKDAPTDSTAKILDNRTVQARLGDNSPCLSAIKYSFEVIMNNETLRRAVTTVAPSAELAKQISAHIIGLKNQSGRAALSELLSLPGIQAAAKAEVENALSDMDNDSNKLRELGFASDQLLNSPALTDPGKLTDYGSLADPGPLKDLPAPRGGKFGR